MSNQQEEKLVVNAVHKWAGTTITICGVIWGAMAYYVRAENQRTQAVLQGQITVLQVQQEQAAEISALVIKIDKKLEGIQEKLNFQEFMQAEIINLQERVHAVEIEQARDR